jgi:hypothetical protein
LKNEELVHGVLQDFETSLLSEKEKVLFRFAGKVNRGSPSIGNDDMKLLYDAEWDDNAIYYTITVVSLFNFYNRWVDASGVHAMSDEAHRQGAIRSAVHGYVRK